MLVKPTYIRLFFIELNSVCCFSCCWSLSMARVASSFSAFNFSIFCSDSRFNASRVAWSSATLAERSHTWNVGRFKLLYFVRNFPLFVGMPTKSRCQQSWPPKDSTRSAHNYNFSKCLSIQNLNRCKFISHPPNLGDKFSFWWLSLFGWFFWGWGLQID